MKTLFVPLLLLLVALANMAEAAIDFSNYPGQYKGSYQIVAGPTTLKGVVTADVTLSKNGKTMTIEIYGQLRAPASPPVALPVYALLKLNTNRTVKSNSALIGYFQLIPTPVKKFTGQKNKFKFTLNASAPINAPVPYVLKFTKKKMSLRGSTIAGGQLITLKFKGNKK